MKTWEMIKELTENREKRFKNQEGRVIAVLPDGDLYLPEEDDNYIRITDEWEEVKEPVTWEEAIQAWLQGKSFKVKYNGGTYTQHCGVKLGILEDSHHTTHGYLSDMFISGEWYIED